MDVLWEALVDRVPAEVDGASSSPPLTSSVLQRLISRITKARGESVDIAVVVREPGRVVFGLSPNAALFHSGRDREVVVRRGGCGGSFRFAVGSEPEWLLSIGSYRAAASFESMRELRRDIVQASNVGGFIQAR